MDTQRNVLFRAIGYLIAEMFFLALAAFGKNPHLPQPLGSYWFTCGGLLAAAFSAWMAHCSFQRWHILREQRRQLEEITHGST